MRYRHNPHLDIQAARERLHELELERNRLERDIDTLAVSRFTEPKIQEMYAHVRQLDRQIEAQRAHYEALCVAHDASAGFPEGTQVAFPFRANPNPRSRRSTTMAAAKDFFRMTREQLVRSSAPGAKAELRRRGRDAQGNRIGGKKAKASSATKSRVSGRAKKAKSKARRAGRRSKK